MTRTAKVVRATAETDIGLSMDLDGTGAADVETGVGFFDHMLCALARHSMIDLTLRVKGDTCVDDHHTVEDTGIVMGQAAEPLKSLASVVTGTVQEDGLATALIDHLGLDVLTDA